MGLSGNDIKQLIQDSNNTNDFCDKLAAAINQNLQVQIPTGEVIISVSGQAVGTPNSSPIVCDIIPG
jgi:hypothetical protein